MKESVKATMTRLETNHHETKKEKLDRQQLTTTLQGLESDQLQSGDWISDRAHAIFDFIMENIQDAGPLVNLDRDTLNIYCQELAIYESASQKLNNEELIIDGKENPLFKIAHRQGTKVLKLAKDLGLSPASRATMVMHNIKDQNAGDPFADLLSD